MQRDPLAVGPPDALELDRRRLSRFWPALPIAAFAVALAAHAWHVYAEKPISEQDIQREMHRGA